MVGIRKILLEKIIIQLGIQKIKRRNEGEDCEVKLANNAKWVSV